MGKELRAGILLPVDLVCKGLGLNFLSGFRYAWKVNNNPVHFELNLSP